MLNRLDSVVLVFPALLYFAVLLLREKQYSWGVILKSVALGLSPILLWELFSLVYYGFWVPNTAYAKLNTGIPSLEYIYQGLRYILYTVDRDPLTILSIFVGILLSKKVPDNRYLLLGIGVLLYLCYVVKIGGGFMAGRFLAAPLFLSTIILVSVPLKNSIRFLS